MPVEIATPVSGHLIITIHIATSHAVKACIILGSQIHGAPAKDGDVTGATVTSQVEWGWGNT